MKIVVCIKIVDGEINPFDACALECALKMQSDEISVLCMGPESSKNALLKISRLDISRVILLSDSSFAGSDTLATSYILSEAIKKISPDLVLCGRQSIDGDTAQVGPCMSEMLGFNVITNVMKIINTDGFIECHTRLGSERAKYPCVLTIERINSLRFPKMRSKPKEIEIWDNKFLKLDLSRCGLKGSPTKVLKTYESKTGIRKCKFITFDELDSVIKDALSKKSAVSEMIQLENSGKKLKSVAITDEALMETALSISERVKVINVSDTKNMTEHLKNEEVVLWKSDLLSRRLAPIAAARLKTGLCADCTHLETDGKRLIMYRPAKSGSLTAKIICNTYPQMATVRCGGENDSDVIFGIGKGVLDDREKYLSLAKKYNAEICASRAVVDLNMADYESQVGLTGKNIKAKVYVACGISGAVQHTCAIEGVETVIAINPDKNARIFEYADFGILGKL